MYIWNVNRWFNIWWWKHLFRPRNTQFPWYVVIWCRLRNHPDGVVWYDPDGIEPDMHCENCGDDLG